MTEDAYRIELIHAWRMRRLNEAIEAVREACHVLEDDIDSIKFKIWIPVELQWCWMASEEAIAAIQEAGLDIGGLE